MNNEQQVDNSLENAVTEYVPVREAKLAPNVWPELADRWLKGWGSSSETDPNLHNKSNC